MVNVTNNDSFFATSISFILDLSSLKITSLTQCIWFSINQCFLILSANIPASNRTHICSCGCVLDRDENVAKNILEKGLKYRRAGGN